MLQLSNNRLRISETYPANQNINNDNLRMIPATETSCTTHLPRQQPVNDGSGILVTHSPNRNMDIEQQTHDSQVKVVYKYSDIN
jgi:hypothetical protein